LEDITQLVARNLKKIREEKKLSLDRLAELTGVSKSMLGQIERGESSPTISIVWKIASGLKISFTSLLDEPRSDMDLVQKTELKPLIEDNGKYRLFPIFPVHDSRRFEIYVVEIDPGGHLNAEAHPDHTEEFITVFKGELTVNVDGQSYRIPSGDSIRFRADKAHIYSNQGESQALIHMVIHYPG